MAMKKTTVNTLVLYYRDGHIRFRQYKPRQDVLPRKRDGVAEFQWAVQKPREDSSAFIFLDSQPVYMANICVRWTGDKDVNAMKHVCLKYLQEDLNERRFNAPRSFDRLYVKAIRGLVKSWLGWGNEDLLDIVSGSFLKTWGGSFGCHSNKTLFELYPHVRRWYESVATEGFLAKEYVGKIYCGLCVTLASRGFSPKD